MKTTLRIRAWSALVAATLILTGCGAASGSFRAVFPRIVIDVDKEGFPSVAGISPMMLSFFGMDPSQFKIPPATVAQLTESNLQHAELLFRNDGLYWWANGKPLVPLTWNDQSFNNTKALISKFNLMNPAAWGVVDNVLLPAARSVEQNIVIRFPRKDGEAEIPVRAMGGPLPEPGATVTPSVIGGLKLTFDDSGVPSIAGVSFAEIQKSLGIDLSAATLPPDTLQQLKNAGIQHITLRTTPEGIKLWSNDQPLPTLRWSPDTLTNTADTVASLKLIDPAIGTVVRQFVPFLNRVDTDVILMFPTGGATAIPLPPE